MPFEWQKSRACTGQTGPHPAEEPFEGHEGDGICATTGGRSEAVCAEACCYPRAETLREYVACALSGAHQGKHQQQLVQVIANIEVTESRIQDFEVSVIDIFEDQARRLGCRIPAQPGVNGAPFQMRHYTCQLRRKG